MDKENIKIGNVWIEDSESIRKRYFLLASIFVSILITSATNVCFLMITIVIYFVIFININSRHIPPSSNPNMIAIHYRTNVNFSKDMCWYPDIFDLMKECYENENLNQKSQKYKIKDVIYLYDSNAENAKKWFEEQNEKNNIII